MVRARIVCLSKSAKPGEDTVLVFGAVAASATKPENNALHSSTDATPFLSISMRIAEGKPAADAIEQGSEYFLDFTPAT